MVALNEILAHNEACPVREIGDGLVIMAPQGEATHSLEESGTFIWNLIDGKKDLMTIAQALVTQYDVDLETATSDLLDFVQDMMEANLLISLEPK